MDSILELATKADVNEITEGSLRVFVEVLVPQADPVFDADATRAFINALTCRFAHLCTCSTFIDSLFENIPRAHALLCGREHFLYRS